MIDLSYWPTPNGWKISIALEEMGLEYRVLPVNIGRGEQFDPQFLVISPNNRIPAIVDHDPADGGKPLSVFESAAILIYLTEKSGEFLPTDLRGRKEVLEWLAWQVGGLGPMLGQAHHFRQFATAHIPYAVERYTKEARRLYSVLNARLAGRAYIVDIAQSPTLPPGRGSCCTQCRARRSTISQISSAGTRRWPPDPPCSAACTRVITCGVGSKSSTVAAESEWTTRRGRYSSARMEPCPRR